MDADAAPARVARVFRVGDGAEAEARGKAADSGPRRAQRGLDRSARRVDQEGARLVTGVAEENRRGGGRGKLPAVNLALGPRACRATMRLLRPPATNAGLGETCPSSVLAGTGGEVGQSAANCFGRARGRPRMA
jgi:hypothetical protein